MTTRYAEGVLHVTLVLDSPAAPAFGRSAVARAAVRAKLRFCLVSSLAR